MGIGLSLVADPGRGFLGRRRDPQRLRRELAAGLVEEARAAEPVLGLFAIARPFEDGQSAFVRLHPAEEDLELMVEGDRVIVSARTNGAGPGYHQWVVELLERVGARHATKWLSEGEGGDRFDETGYFERRDRQELERHMLGWLRQIAQLIRDDPEMTELVLSMPIGAPRPAGVEIASPMGRWTREWFLRVAQATPSELRAAAREFFPWWDPAVNATAIRNLGLIRCWWDVLWRQPSNEEEARTHRIALRCLLRARELDSGIALPDRELAELERLQEAAPGEEVPRPDGIGFRRRALRIDLPGRWSAELPGYFSYQRDDDGTHVWWHGSRSIHQSAYSRRDDAPTDSLPAKAGAIGTWERTEERLRGRAQLFRDDAEDGTWFRASAVLISGRSLCALTLVWARDEDRAWAEGIFRSVRPPAEPRSGA